MAGEFQDKKILVVDDDPDILTAITTSLADTGASVETASDGVLAVNLIEDKSPDVVILDIMLPKKSGFLVLEKIKKGKPRGSKPRVIMITGNQGTRHKQYAEALGVDVYLSKPFTMERLFDSLKKLTT
ncbi:MAG: Transcriptional regulatory protein WalR [Phycisphaerae bacterium]|nr:Transcriptional regulatory protein WalR [Phycisphaerae bacterium]